MHTNRDKGVGLKSDTHGGPDDYDLPPATTAAALASVATPEDKAIANGAPPEDEQWKKTGWAPRFHVEDTHNHEDALLSEHQTFVELPSIVIVGKSYIPLLIEIVLTQRS